MMNKFTMVLGAAAVATLAGCKDPDYTRGGAAAQNEVKNADTTVAVTPVAKCTCPPGTKHTAPCMCGAPDCKCIVEAQPIVVKPVPVVKPVVAPKPVEPEYTIYIVQNGDYLAKISKKFNVTINSIRRLNPSIKRDMVRVGQKLKLPGKIDVGVQSAPARTVVKSAAKAGKTAAKKGYQPYKGETKEYVVKNGDTLGSVAYGNGCNIRQLKELNGLTKDSLRIGQKLKVPANGAAAKKSVAKAASSKAEAAKPATTAPAEPVEAKPAENAAAPAPAEAPAAPAEAAPAADGAATDSAAADTAAEQKPAEAKPATTNYLVQEGDDMTSVSIRWGVSAAEIRELNNLGENDQLTPGQTIRLPAEAQQ